MTIAFVFPGQGSQTTGMGKSFYDNFSIAKQIVELAEDSLQLKLSTLMFEGPTEELTKTENAQPALLTASMMAFHVLQSEFGKPLLRLKSCVAGHSLGEYSALVAAEVITFQEAIRAVRHRGLEMQKAVPGGVGAMAAVLGLDLNIINEILKDYQDTTHYCQIANDNCEGQIVISGHKGAVESASEVLKSAGAKRCLMLPVSGPFHTPLMQPAAEAMGIMLEKVKVNEPKIPWIMNTSANVPTTFSKDMLINTLKLQMTNQVKWRESMIYMHQQLNVHTFLELGVGKVLNGLVKRTIPTATISSVCELADLNANLQILSECSTWD